MKIERPSVVITEIPYFDSIEIMPSGILLTRGASEQTCHPADIEALRDALTEAIRIKREIDGTPVAPRVFAGRTAEPDDTVTHVRDHEDDLWRRLRGAWYLQGRSDVTGEGDGTPWSWEQLVSTYGPLTEER